MLVCVLAVVGCLSLQQAMVQGEVVSKSENRFQVRHVVTIEAEVNDVFKAMHEDVGSWWNSAHTYSADASNMYIELKPHGWFGEKMPDGGFVCHLEIIQVQMNKMIRFQGGLGPLQGMPVSGVMTWAVRSVDDGTELTLLYDVSGESEPKVEALAGPVDQVLAQQVSGLKKWMEKEQEQ